MRKAWNTFWAIVRMRCPRCRTGRIFKGMFAMNDPCPHCGLLFQREEGYFLGAMYVSYGIATVILTVLFFTAKALLPGWDSIQVALLVMLLYLPLSPAVFRYSRVVWIYLDRVIDPHGALAGPYEKTRLREQADHETGSGKQSGGEDC
jgi:uncharacterized protein (DUF983 family)